MLASPTVAWPLRRGELAPLADGACAVVLASRKWVEARGLRPVWLKGFAWAVDSYHLGSRRLSELSSLRSAARRAYAMAGIKDPAREITVAEIYAPFTSTEIAAVEALGFCPKGRGGPMNEEGMFEMDGALPVNPSGGTLCANPIAVTALVRVCDTALQVMGRAGHCQVKGVRHAVATGIGGSLQFHTCMVLSSDYR